MFREKELKSLRDLERTQARIARIEAQRRDQTLEQEHQKLQKKILGKGDMEF